MFRGSLEDRATVGVLELRWLSRGVSIPDLAKVEPQGPTRSPHPSHTGKDRPLVVSSRALPGLSGDGLVAVHQLVACGARRGLPGSRRSLPHLRERRAQKAAIHVFKSERLQDQDQVPGLLQAYSKSPVEVI